MNKLFKILSTTVLGVALAVGVGVGVAQSGKAKEVGASSPVTLTTSTLTGTSSDGAIGWSSVKGDAGTTPGIYNNAIRLYQNGAFIQLEGKSGAKITGFTAHNTGTYATTANYAVSDNSFGTTTPKDAGTDTSVAESGSYTVSGLNSSYVAIICRGTTNKTRFEVSSISVSYTSSKTLSSIAVKTAPTKTVYVAGESFDATGLVITATFSDDSKEDISYAGNETLFTFDPTIITEAGNVTITYGEKSTTQAVTLVTYTDVTGVASSPSKIALNGTLALADVLLNINLSNGSSTTVNPTSISLDTSSLGDKVGTATFSPASGVKTANFNISVVAEATYVFSGSNFTSYASEWGNTYSTHEGLNGKNDLGGEYAATVDLYHASKQTTMITTMPVFATKTALGSWTKVVGFKLEEDGYAISSVSVTFAQWSNRKPNVALFAGSEVSGTPISTLKIDSESSALELSGSMNALEFSIGYCDGTASNVQSGLASITVGVRSSGAVTYAKSFNDAGLCDGGVTAPSTSTWSSLSTSYSSLDVLDKELFVNGDADESGSAFCQCLARYDYILGKYGTTSYSNFMGRTVTPVGSASVLSTMNADNNIIIIVVISVVSLTALGGYFFIRRRKETH